MDRADKRVAIALLMETYKEEYWNKPIKKRLEMVKLTVQWLKQRHPFYLSAN